MKRVATLLARALFAAFLLVAVSAQVASADPGPDTTPSTSTQPEDPGTSSFDTQPQDPGVAQ